jgi:SsrA-binding protein
MAKAKSKTKKAAESPSGDRTITVNRRAFFNYEILERYEAGLVLTGSEIKSIRTGRVDLSDAYVRPVDGELWLNNAHIATYGPAGIYNHEPKRARKVLLHRAQIHELADAVHQKGLTVVALRLYIRNHVAKVQLGLARGKRQYDKRRTIRDRELDMQARQALSSR